MIEDSKGNQFVWIPVKNASDFTRNLSSYPADYSNATYAGDAGGEPEGGYSAEQVVSKGGFYVSRFWVTKDSNGSRVSKKGMDASRTNSNANTRANHVTSLRSFINTPYAKTSLISGIAYDLMMGFVNNKRYSKGLFNVNTVYSASSFITGEEEGGKVCNICDLVVPSGGVMTSELGSTPYLTGWPVLRGYTLAFSDVRCPSFRGYGGTNLGFLHAIVRATLYVY